MLFLPLDGIIDKLKNNTIEIFFSTEYLQYRKRSFEFKSDNRIQNIQEINYIIKGRIFGTAAGEEIHLNSGDVFWMQPQTPHSLTWEKNLIYYSFRFVISDPQDEITVDQPFLLFKNANDLEALFRSIVYTLKYGSGSRYMSDELRSYFLLLVIGLDRIKQKSLIEGSKRELSEMQQRIIEDYCLNHEFIGIDSRVLSQHLGLSQDYFSRIFKNTYGKSAKEWIFEERMKYAAKLLIDTGISVDKLAELLGYYDIYLFSRQFKKVLGLTPKRYMEKNRLMSEK